MGRRRFPGTQPRTGACASPWPTRCGSTTRSRGARRCTWWAARPRPSRSTSPRRARPPPNPPPTAPPPPPRAPPPPPPPPPPPHHHHLHVNHLDQHHVDNEHDAPPLTVLVTLAPPMWASALREWWATGFGRGAS